MIQKYLIPGVRLKWNAPAATQQALDGAIVANRGIPSIMTYDGLDGELINPTTMAINVTSMGFRMKMPLQHMWLDYNQGRTSRCLAGRDVLTGFMSGCIIARWTQAGANYVGHVGTLVGNKATNDLVKNTFLNTAGANVTGFNPALWWDQAECNAVTNKFKKKPTAKVMALVSSSGKFFSILMLQLDWTKPDEWCVGGIKSVPPLNRAALAIEMNKM